MRVIRSAWITIIMALSFLLAACGGSSSSGGSTDTGDSAQVVADADSDGVEDSADNCPDDANEDQADSDVDGAGDACDAIPTSYAFTNAQEEDTVSYTGQTKRHIFIEDMVDTIQTLVEGGVPTDGAPDADVVGALNFFFRYSAATSDELTSSFSLSGETLLPNNGSTMTYGSISSGKDLTGKIAGGNGEGGGETSRLIDGEFFGWEEGLTSTSLPVDLVDYLFAQLQTEATDNQAPSIAIGTSTVPLDIVTVDAFGRDYRQLIQKFLVGAVTFSQGTNDYFQTDFANSLALEDGKSYTAAEHDWDEAFGYFGAARNYGDYTDDEIAIKGGRAEFANGYNDANGDGLIDIRSEVNFGHSTNCAKRDRGTVNNANPTNFTQDAFDAFLLGREILKNAVDAGELTAEAQTALDAQIEIASVTWEKCIAATVVHYINDTIGDMDNFDTDNGSFADLDSFKNLAKHWAEMKGFALGLQFSPASPFRASADALNNLQQVLSLMGDAPVLADGTQAGVAFEGGVAAYREDLLEARGLLQSAYNFDTTNVENW